MHVCFLNMPIEYYSPTCGGAVSTIIMETGRELLALGHRVSVLTRVNAEPVHAVGQVVPLDLSGGERAGWLRRKWSGLKGRMRGWDWPRYDRYRREFRSALRRLSPDVVIMFNDLVSAQFVQSVCPRAARLVWLQNECRTRQRNVARAAAAVDRFMACSRYIAQWTSDFHRIDRDHFTVVHSGIDLKTFHPREGYLERRRPLRGLFIGRIDPNKGPDIAADTVARLRAEGAAVELTIAGGLWFYGHGREMEDPFFRQLKEKADQAGARYLGHLERRDVPGYVRDHDVAFVLSRSHEPFGLVVLEAMASGLAVIASDRGGLPESCGGAAALVDPDDLGSVVNALRSLIDVPSKLAEMKAASVDRAARAGWSRCAGVIERLVTEVSSTRRSGASKRHEPAVRQSLGIGRGST